MTYRDTVYAEFFREHCRPIDEELRESKRVLDLYSDEMLKLLETVMWTCAAQGGLVDELVAALEVVRAERDQAKEQLQKIGRKAFWASKGAGI